MSARPPTRRYEARKHAIVASAVEVMNRKGVRGMTLGEIAARLDLVPTGVIYYFRNKEELAQACYIASLARFDELVADAARAGTPAERVSSFIAGYFAFRAQVARGEADPIAAFNDVRALNAPAVNTAYVDMFRRLRGQIGRAHV